MRGYHKRRSVLSTTIWCGAFALVCVVLAWKFQWLPGSGSGSPVETTTADDDAVNVKIERPPKDNPVPTVDDPFVFSRQSEPGGLAGRDFDMPNHFEAPVPPTGDSGTGTPAPRFPANGAERGRGLGSKDDAPAGDTRRRVEPRDTPRAGGGSSSIKQAGFQSQKQRDTSAPPSAALGRIDGLIRAGKYLDAHKELSQLYWSDPAWRDAIRTRIEMTAKAIYFDRRPHLLAPYVVQPGDQLRNIARKYGVSWQYLERLNGITARQIRPGMKLKVIKGPFKAVVDLSDREITIHHYGYFVCRYPVGIGKDGKTPLGKRIVKGKLVNPPYDGRDEYGRAVSIRADDPRNPLGERWIDLGDSYGIHGTIDPRSIGKAESRGCIRLHNKDVEVVYDFLTPGSEVVIQR
ncbi:MAG: L,D-transpeptidase family protein [Planctomycetaceae bacterium]